MCSRAFLEDRIESVFLEKVNGRARIGEQAVLSPGAEPDQLEIFLQARIIQVL